MNIFKPLYLIQERLFCFLVKNIKRIFFVHLLKDISSDRFDSVDSINAHVWLSQILHVFMVYIMFFIRVRIIAMIAAIRISTYLRVWADDILDSFLSFFYSFHLSQLLLNHLAYGLIITSSELLAPLKKC